MKMNFATIFKMMYDDPHHRTVGVYSEFEYVISVCRRMANKGYGQHTFHDIPFEGDELKQLVGLMKDEGFTVKADEFLHKFRVRWDGHDFPAERTYGFGA